MEIIGARDISTIIVNAGSCFYVHRTNKESMKVTVANKAEIKLIAFQDKTEESDEKVLQTEDSLVLDF
jgi:hypothetical protein